MIGTQQFACHKHKNANDTVLNVIDTIQFMKRKSIANAGLLAINFTSTFDSMKHSFLISCLKMFIFGGFYVSMVETALSHRTGTVYNDAMQNIGRYRINVGVLQGDIVAPYLFVIALAPLILMLSNTPTPRLLSNQSLNRLQVFKNVNLCFADDVSVAGAMDQANV